MRAGLRIDLGDPSPADPLDAARARLFRKFDPDQPRVPAGSSEGVQWTSGVGGCGIAPDGTLVELAADFLINLLTEEGGSHDGHTIRDHVGKSEESLLFALRARQLEMDWNQAEGLRLGSFPSLVAANKLVNSTISANQEDIDAFLKGQWPILKISSYFESPTGFEAFAETPRSQPYIRTTYGASAILVLNPSAKNGFSVLTAFPIK